MRQYKHKTLGVIIEVESVIGGEWEELIPPSEEPVQTEEEKPKKRRTTKKQK